MSTQGLFNFFLYDLLVILIVHQKRTLYENLPLPQLDEIIFGVMVCIGSFVFDLSTRGIFAGGYGQSDYVILVVGITLLFFGIRNIKKIYPPVVLVGTFSAALKILQLVYENYVEVISGWFVTLVISITTGLGYPTYVGTVGGNGYPSNTFTVIGLNETASLEVAWGCTGLRSLLLFSFILAALLIPYRTTRGRKTVALISGVVGAFLVNILRLVMLALIMYYYDIATTLWVHQHLGDFLFVIWVALFWWAAMKYILLDEEDELPMLADLISQEPPPDN